MNEHNIDNSETIRFHLKRAFYLALGGEENLGRFRKLLNGAGTSEFFKDWSSYSALFLFVLLSYVLVIGPYIKFTDAVIPMGDPFTYTVDWFHQIDLARNDYFGMLHAELHGNWYRLMHFLIALVALWLPKEPFAIAIVNFIVWGGASCSFLWLGRRLGLSNSVAYLTALIPWIWPVNYGFSDYSSIPVLGLDAAFQGALLMALGSSFVFAMAPERRWAGFLAALSIGLAIWGRGNSLPVVGLVVCWPWLWALIKSVRSGNRRSIINVFVFGLLAVSMTAEYVYFYFDQLMEYHGVHLTLATQSNVTFAAMKPYLMNIPGFMLWRVENAIPTQILSVSSHLFVMGAAVFAWRWKVGPGDVRPQAYRQLIGCGVFIYTITFLTNLLLFNDARLHLHNSAYIWRPMLIGLTLVIIPLFMNRFSRWIDNFPKLIVATTTVAMLIWGVMWTNILTPWDRGVGRPLPTSVERFAVGLDQMCTGACINFLWYGSWNPAIINYYRIKNGMGNPNYNTPSRDRWRQVDHSPAVKKQALKEMKDIFMKSDIIFMPEYMDAYENADTYLFYKTRKDWVSWLNSAEAPKFRVVMLLKESPNVNLIGLMREEKAQGRGDPLELPYDVRAKRPVSRYSAAVTRFK